MGYKKKTSGWTCICKRCGKFSERYGKYSKLCTDCVDTSKENNIKRLKTTLSKNKKFIHGLHNDKIVCGKYDKDDVLFLTITRRQYIANITCPTCYKKLVKLFNIIPNKKSKKRLKEW